MSTRFRPGQIAFRTFISVAILATSLSLTPAATQAQEEVPPPEGRPEAEPPAGTRRLEPGLRLYAACDPPAVEPGGQATCTVTAANEDKADLSNLTLSARLPGGLSLAGQRGSAGVWRESIPGLAVGERATRQFTLDVGPDVSGPQTFAVHALDGLKSLGATTGIVGVAGAPETRWVGRTGGELNGDGGRVRVRFPDGALRAPTGAHVSARTHELRVDPRIQAAAEQPQRGGTLLRFTLEARDVTTGDPVERFARPVDLSVDLRGLVDQAGLPAGQHIYLAYVVDAKTGEKQRVPSVYDAETGLLTAQVDHFSDWEIGMVGEGWKPMLTPPVPDLFSGAATYSYPIQVPAGRNGLQPGLALSYNSRQIDRLTKLEEEESGPIALGWSLDGVVEISRKNGYSGGGRFQLFGDFFLVLGGTSYRLEPDDPDLGCGRYWARNGPGVYVERRNPRCGDSTAQNWTKDYWIVRGPDGTEYRLGFTGNSEVWVKQDYYDLHLECYDVYCNDEGGRFGAMRYRVDTITDRLGNQMAFTYREKTIEPGNHVELQRSLVAKIRYNNYDATKWASRVAFVPVSEDEGDEGYMQLSRIEVYHLDQLIRQVELTTDEATRDGYSEWALMRIREFSGDGSPMAPVEFRYQALPNQGSDDYVYRRISEINLGYGGRTTFAYVDDGRSEYRYSYRVSETKTYDGMSDTPSRVTYAYGQRCYDQKDGSKTAGGALCRGPYAYEHATGPLIGHNWVMVTTHDFAGAVVNKTKHSYYITDTGDNHAPAHWRRGKEWHTTVYAADGATKLQETDTHWVATQWEGDNVFSYVDETVSTDHYGAESVSTKTRYEYAKSLQDGVQYGNLTHVREYGTDGTEPYRTTVTEYNPNADPAVWIVGTPKRVKVFAGNANDELLSRVQTYYDGSTDLGEDPDEGKPTMTRVYDVNDDSWHTFVQTTSTYDDWGNLVEVTDPRGYTTAIEYEDTYHLYPVAATNALGHERSVEYYGVNGTGSDGMFVIGDDENASGSMYVHVPDGEGNRMAGPDEDQKVTLTFRNVAAGQYKIQGWAYTPDTDGDSFWVKVDDAPSGGYLWDVEGSVYYHQDDYVNHHGGADPVVVTLSQGTHTVSVYLREDGTRLDRIALVPVNPSLPTLKLEAEHGIQIEGGLTGQVERVWDSNGANTATKYTYDPFGRLTRVMRPGDYNLNKPTTAYWYDESTANTRVVQEVYSEKWRDHAYNTVANWETAEDKDYAYQRAPFRVSATQAAGTIPLHRYLYTGGTHAYQHNTKYVTGSSPGAHWEYQKVLGYIWTSSDPGRVGLYRCGVLEANTYDHLLVTGDEPCPAGYDDDGRPRLGYVEPATAPIRVGVSQREKSGQAGTLDSYVYYDGLGREVQARSEAAGGEWTVASTAYDALGRAFEGYVPRLEGGLAYTAPGGAHTLTAYDALGRVTTVTAPDGVQVKHYYGKDIDNALVGQGTGLWKHAAVDGNGHVHHYVSDAFGNLVLVRELDGVCAPGACGPDNLELYAETGYVYDELGHLTQVTDGATVPVGGNVTTMHYDGLGRKASMDDPDMGHWEYEYDEAGNLTEQTDAKGQTLTFVYDPLNRLVSKSAGGQVLAEYEYDCGGGTCPAGNYGIGRRTGMVDTSGAADWTYDKRGRVTKESKTIDSQTFDTQYTYDAADRVETMTYPDGEVVTHDYDDGGALETLNGIDPYVTGISYNAVSQIETLAYGNGVTTDYEYDPLTFRLENVQASKGSNPLLDLTYDYDDVGNVVSIADAINDDQVQHFSYDHLDRLTDAWTTGGGDGVYDRSYEYDEIGNITHKDGVGDYGYNDPNHVHAVTHTGGQRRYWYDANGNQTTRVADGKTYIQTFTAENKLHSVTVDGATTTFFYDGDGNRVKKVDPDGNATYYAGGTYEIVLGPTVDGRHWGVDGGGGLVPDGSGYEEHGEVHGAQWVEGGVSDRALDFDGVNDYVAFDAEPAIEGELTVSAWVRPEQAPTGLGRLVAGTYAHNGGGSNRRGWALGNTYGSADRFSFQVFDETGSYGIASLDGFFDTYQDEWVYVTGVFKPGESVALYVDGEKVAEDVTGVPTAIGLSGKFKVGARADNTSQGHWDGQIDEVRVVGRALSQGEIQDLLTVGMWKIEEGSGNLVLDGSGHGQDGEVHGAQWVDGGVSERALDFDGVNDYVSFDNEPAIQGELTVGAWVRPEQAPTGLGRMVAGTYAHNGGGSNRRGWVLGDTYGSADQFCFQVFDETGSYGIASLDGFFATYQNQWVYVTGVFKPGESVALYVDGEKVAEDVTGVPTEIGLSGLFEIGSRADNTSQGHWDGQIDEVRVVGRALRQGEIQDLVQAGSGAGQFHPAYVTSAIKYYRYCAMSSCQAVAMRKDGLVTYLHPDHLGSTSLTTDAGGAKVARVLYYPYGEERYREGTLQTDYQFTGQRREGFGLYDYQARFYDPYLNRFISPDTIVPNPANPQSLNRFAYVYNNPLKYTDPTGHCAKGDKECEYQRCVDQGGDAKICSRQIKGGGGQGQQGGRYLCNSQYGCFDKWHLGTGDPASIIRQVERAIAAGGGTVVVPGTISTPIDGVGLSFVGYYYVSGDADLDAVGVAYAIHQHWSIAFEAWEGTLPGGEATSFAIEDLPSHHVGFFMAANGLSRDQAFALLGEFEETNEDPTRSVKNYSFTPLVQDESGNYSHVSWPEAMQITPIDNGWTHIEWDQEIRYRGQPVVSVSTLGDAGASAGPLLFGCFWRFLGR